MSVIVMLDASNKSSSSSHTSYWVTILHRFQLMQDPHYENDAQFYHTIPTSLVKLIQSTTMNNQFVEHWRVRTSAIHHMLQFL